MSYWRSILDICGGEKEITTIIDEMDVRYDGCIDRDSFVKYFSAIFGTMAEVSTFTNYTSASKERGKG